MKKNNNKNRDLTGLERTPSSMAWLIKKKAILIGKIEKGEKLLRELPDQIAAMKAEASALDIVIPMHEVIIDPHAIKGRQPKSKPVLPYGVVTRGIYECLRQAEDKPITSLEISMHIAKAHGIHLTRSSPIKTAVKKRLKNMASENKVIRHHDTNTRDYGVWSLPKDW